ncbi:hypothetical protein [Acaryochloris sp. IP29b_bin.137]|uniref:hypothetical protein n=1 Tax=Acaryochloris sp. IP29b_bin.137 TaxID=2969217 RepID=UPI00261F4AE5|nr:hypothetical protein [Acaryochloris sp. IP29b_bin.137]
MGGSGADKLVGGNGDDWAIGGLGDDVFVGSSGEDTFIGGLGDDTVQYRGSLSDFVFNGGPDYFQVMGVSGTHTLKGIEFLEFTDGRVTVDNLPFLASI